MKQKTVVGGFMVTTATLSAFVSNTATTLLMLPIALASSLSFILPAGTPPNSIVIGSGYVSSRQMAKVGLPLDLLAIAIVTLTGVVPVPLVWG